MDTTIASVKHHKDHQLEVELSTGQRKIIDLGDFIKNHPRSAFKEYEDIEIFKGVYLDDIMGGPSWPGNGFDINPKSVIDGEFDVGEIIWTEKEKKKYLEMVEEVKSRGFNKPT